MHHNVKMSLSDIEDNAFNTDWRIWQVSVGLEAGGQAVCVLAVEPDIDL